MFENAMQKAAGLIANTTIKTGGRSVLYGRGAVVIELTAAMGRADIEDIGVDLEAVTANAADWFVEVADLVIDGVEVTPIRGDVIEWDGKFWEVVQRGESKAWRFVTQGRKLYRIFTVEVAVK